MLAFPTCSSCAAQCTSETSVMLHAANMKYRVNMPFAHIFPPARYSCLNSLFGHARVLDLFVSLFVHDKSSTVHCGARLCKWCVISTQRHEFPTRDRKQNLAELASKAEKAGLAESCETTLQYGLKPVHLQCTNGRM